MKSAGTPAQWHNLILLTDLLPCVMVKDMNSPTPVPSCKSRHCDKPTEAKLYRRGLCRPCYLREHDEHMLRKKVQDLRVAILAGDKERAAAKQAG